MNTRDKVEALVSRLSPMVPERARPVSFAFVLFLRVFFRVRGAALCAYDALRARAGR